MGERDCRILLADDHPVISTGIRLALKQVPGLNLLEWVDEPDAAVSMSELWNPDAIILDLVFHGSIELGLVRRCRAVAPRAAIVVFTSLPADPYRDDSVAAGADAFVGKHNDLEVLIGTVARLLGQPLRPATPAPLVRLEGAAAAAGPLHLTRRENEIARLLSHGTPLVEIATQMGISPKTAAVHRDNLRKKLGCRDTNELIARLARHFGTLEGA